MAHKIGWMLEDQVIFLYATGNLDTQTFAEINQDIVAFIHQGLANNAPRVHLVVETRQVPKIAGPLEIAKTMTFLKEKNLGQVVVGGIGNPIMPFLAKMISNLAGVKITVLETPEEAIHLLQRKDVSLPDLVPLYRRISDSFLV